MRSLLLMLVCAAAGLFLWSHWPGTDYAALAAARDARAREGRGDIVVAAVMDARQSDYVNGVRLAVQQINAREQRLLGRAVQLRIEQAADEPQPDLALVDRLVNDDRVVAVLGHRPSRVALPASLVYESARVVFMPPFATRKSLTGHDFQYVFRMAPSSPVMAEQLASLAATLGYGRVAILHARDEYSRELAFLFEDAALARGVQIARRSSFLATEEDYRGLIAELRSRPFDAVFLSAATAAGARMASQLRELGVRTPIIGIDSLDMAEYSRLAGPAADRTIVPVLYRGNQPGWRNAQFVQQFQAAFGHAPDANAAQGYDAMLLLADAIETAKTTRTSAIASALRFMPYWIGVTGLHAFDQRGELLAKHYQFQWRLDGQWNVLPGLQLRHQVERADENARLEGEPLRATRAALDGLAADLPPLQLAQQQYELAHRMLRWQRLGAIVALDEGEPAEVALRQVRRLAGGDGTNIETCVLHQASVEADLARCLELLPSQQAEALMLVGFDNIGVVDVKAMESRLRGTDLPVFALGATDNETMPPGLALFIDTAARQADLQASERLIGQLVSRQAVEPALQRLSQLPVLKADLRTLQALGVQRNSTLLDLFAEEMPPAPPRERMPGRPARARSAPAAGSAPADKPAPAPAPAQVPASPVQPAPATAQAATSTS